MRHAFLALVVLSVAIGGCRTKDPQASATPTPAPPRASAAPPPATDPGPPPSKTPVVDETKAQVDALVKDGKVKFALGDFQGSLDAMTKALELAPGDTEAALYVQKAKTELARIANPVAATPEPPPTPMPSDEDRKKSVPQLLAEAEKLLKQEKFALPPGDNAFEKYRAVLEKEPLNREARGKIVYAVDTCKKIGKAHLDKGSYVKALEYFAQAQAMSPSDPEIRDLVAKAQGTPSGPASDAPGPAHPAPAEPPSPAIPTTPPPSPVAGATPAAPPPTAAATPQAVTTASPAPGSPAAPPGSTEASPPPKPVETRPPVATPPPVTVQLTPPPVVNGKRGAWLKSKVQATYPREAWAKNLEGVVTLKVLVGTDGSVGDVKVELSSGYLLLDQAAMDAARGYRFEPALENGKPSPSWVNVAVSFTRP
ncbi:MAG: TonB family protein [Acidobacteriota bacterium]